VHCLQLVVGIGLIVCSRVISGRLILTGSPDLLLNLYDPVRFGRCRLFITAVQDKKIADVVPQCIYIICVSIVREINLFQISDKVHRHRHIGRADPQRIFGRP
jgi:hypothetical protein